MIIRTFQKGRLQNLYDQNKHSILLGVLYFYRHSSDRDELPNFEGQEEKNNTFPQKALSQKARSDNSIISDFIQFAFVVDRVVFSSIHFVCNKMKTGWKQFARKFQLQNNRFHILSWVTTNSLFSTQIYHKFVFLVKHRLLVAALFLLISFLSFGSLIFPLVSAELSLAFVDFQSVANEVPKPTPFTYNSYYVAEKEGIYPIREFRLVIPKIHLESNIVDNVDPKIENEYKDKLQFGVAHAKGSYLPPESGGPVYLFAHSTDTVLNIARFNAKFYSVRELEKNDEIIIYFNSKEYRYLVTDKFIINPHEVDIVKDATDTDLILQTCWPPGTDWQRLIVFAKKIEGGRLPQ